MNRRYYYNRILVSSRWISFRFARVNATLNRDWLSSPPPTPSECLELGRRLTLALRWFEAIYTSAEAVYPKRLSKILDPVFLTQPTCIFDRGYRSCQRSCFPRRQRCPRNLSFHYPRSTALARADLATRSFSLRREINISPGQE